MKTMIRSHNGVLVGAPIEVADDSIMDPAMVPVLDDPRPVVDPATHKVVFDVLISRDGGSWAQRTWKAVPRDPVDILDDVDKAALHAALAKMDAALVKLDDNTATVAELRSYVAFLVRYVRRNIKQNGV